MWIVVKRDDKGVVRMVYGRFQTDEAAAEYAAFMSERAANAGPGSIVQGEYSVHELTTALEYSTDFTVWKLRRKKCPACGRREESE